MNAVTLEKWVYHFSNYLINAVEKESLFIINALENQQKLIFNQRL